MNTQDPKLRLCIGCGHDERIPIEERFLACCPDHDYRTPDAAARYARDLVPDARAMVEGWILDFLRTEPTPSALPVPALDLEAILEKSKRTPFQYHDLGALLNEDIPALIAECRALRSRLSEVEGSLENGPEATWATWLEGCDVTEKPNDGTHPAFVQWEIEGYPQGFPRWLCRKVAAMIREHLSYPKPQAGGDKPTAADPVIDAAMEITRAWYAGKRIGDEYLAAIYSACVARDPSVKYPHPGEAK